MFSGDPRDMSVAEGNNARAMHTWLPVAESNLMASDKGRGFGELVTAETNSSIGIADSTEIVFVI